MAPAAKKAENWELVLYRLDLIDKKLDTMSKQYVTKEEFEAAREKDRVTMIELENKLDAVIRKTRFEKFVYSITSALVVGFISVVFNILMNKN
jgi:hypothetical protein